VRSARGDPNQHYNYVDSRPLTRIVARDCMSRSLLKTPLVDEQHYRPAELAAMWNFSPGTIRRLIQDEQGVLRLQGVGEATGKRRYTTYSVPASVAQRIHERLSQNTLKSVSASKNPRTVKFLRDRRRSVA
jgi:hypothetical protein